MSSAPSARARVKRLPDRARYERTVVEDILDEALICHVGFVVDGQPYVIPTIHARDGDRLYLHGSAASRMLRTLNRGLQACVTASIVDGLVLARSAFHHSVNDGRLAGGAESRAGRRLLSVLAMFAGGLAGALLVLRKRPELKVAAALIVLVIVALMAGLRSRTDRPWVRMA